MIIPLDILAGLPLASAEAVVFLLFAAGVTAMTAVAFVFWFGYVAVKGLVMLLAKLAIWPLAGGAEPTSPRRLPCPDPVCRSVNPPGANYCRQCGRVLRHSPTAA